MDPIRDLGFIAWKDPDAWIESMKGTNWNALLKEENSYKQRISKLPSVKDNLELYKETFQEIQVLTNNTAYIFHTGPIAIHYISSVFLHWHWLGSSTNYEARDILSQDGSVWLLKDIGNGSETMKLEYIDEPYENPSWSIQPVGPDFAILGDHCYYLGVTKKLWYNSLWRCDAKTGLNKTCLYTVTNPEINLGLQRHANKKLVCTMENSQQYRYYEIQENKPASKVLKSIASPYSTSSWILPLGSYGIELCWHSKGLLITKHYGQRTLWQCSETRAPKRILSIPAGQILLDPHAVWEDRLPCTIRIDHPSDGINVYKLNEPHQVETQVRPQKTTNKYLEVLYKSPPSGLVCKRAKCISRDGTSVFTASVYNTSSKPKKLMVIGYGAYGIPTGFGSVLTHWAPLVKSDWCIACVFIRGGGDHTEAWGKAGQLEKRANTFDDFEAGIRSLQALYSISPSKTAIYGRSAGGLLVGNMLRKFPNGSLMKCVYTEVPYVDVLRTTTNDSLPLTQLEYNEFGNPRERLKDFINILQTSPTDSAVELETPNIFIFARTAVHDSEVYAYEPIKWIRRLRKASPKGAPKLLCIESEQGHFTPPSSQLEQYSLDTAILNAWMENQLTR